MELDFLASNSSLLAMLDVSSLLQLSSSSKYYQSLIIMDPKNDILWKLLYMTSYKKPHEIGIQNANDKMNPNYWQQKCIAAAKFQARRNQFRGVDASRINPGLYARTGRRIF